MIEILFVIGLLTNQKVIFLIIGYVILKFVWAGIKGVLQGKGII